MNITAAERSSLVGLIRCFDRQHVVLLGDLVADEYVYGEIARVSREAPVLILKQREKQIVPGGGANAANNLLDLGACVSLVGVLGRDDSGEALARYFEQKGLSMRRVVRPRAYQTPTKSRVLGGHTHWQRQQIVRVDREPAVTPGRELRRRLSLLAARELRDASALLISDYGYGATDAREAEFLGRRGGRRKFLITVDSRYNLRTYKGVTAATPNEPEVEDAFGQRIGTNLEFLRRLVKRLLRQQGFEALVVTRGRDGMVLFEAGREPRHLPIFGSDQVADVTGAGDTVIAAFTLALAAGASFYQAAQLANCAAGLVVMKRGTATVKGRELEEAVRNS